MMDLSNITRMIDISSVRADVTLEELDRLAEAARKYKFYAAFTMPCFTSLLIEKLKESETLVGGPVGYPSGAETTSIKVLETREMILMGAREIDMVINIGALKSGKTDIVKNDIAGVVREAAGTPVKCIIEAALLTDDEIGIAGRIVAGSGASYVKTGTGWAAKPTTVQTIRLLKNAVGDSVKIKAAGGVRDLDTMIEMIAAGCSRFGVGMNSAIAIAEEAKRRMA